MATPMLPIRPEWPKVFMDMTGLLRQRSCCLKYQTAAMVVNGTQIISLGYNGTFAKSVECKDYWFDYYRYFEIPTTFEEFLRSDEFKQKHRQWSIAHEVHAEVNALNWVSKKEITDAYVLYTWYSPCDQCAKTIISYGIKNVYYRHLYPSGESALLSLVQNNVNCKQV
jgi:dCMP deaminase